MAEQQFNPGVSLAGAVDLEALKHQVKAEPGQAGGAPAAGGYGIQMDENVTCEKKEGGVVLTFHMAGTNGEACMAELRLSSPAVPETPETPEGPESQGKVTLLNEKHGIQLTGEGLTSDMQLSVKALDKKHADVKLMEKELSSKEQLSNPIEIQLLKDGKEIALPHKAELQLPVGERYNGK